MSNEQMPLDEYKAKLAGLTNYQLVEETADRIYANARIAGSRLDDGYADHCVNACYAESASRGNTDLYQRGFNKSAEWLGQSAYAQPTPTPLSVGEPAPAIA
jgi:hypothetical protein